MPGDKMVLPIEEQFASNIIEMFGGSELLVGIVALSFFIAIIALTKIPIPIVAPIYALTLTIIALYIIPSLAFPLAIVIALIIASFIYSIWGR